MSRSRISLLAGFVRSTLLLVAVLVWATAAPVPTAQRAADAAQPPPPTGTPIVTPVRPVPTSMPPAHPGVGAVIGARSTYPPGTPDILNHAAFNLSLGGEEGDCPGCPIPILDVLGLNAANEGVLASYELNPSNARQQLSDNWEWYWPKITNTVYLWASAPQETVGGEWRPLFTPGMIYIRAGAWHQDPWNEWHQPHPTFCVIPTVGPSVTPGGPAVFNVDRDREPTEGRIIAPPFLLGTFTSTPTEGPPPTSTPLGTPPPTPGPTMLPTEWKYWACAGPMVDEDQLPTFEMYRQDLFTAWIQRQPGMQYIVGNEEEYYMLPDAYAAWFKLVRDAVRPVDPTAGLYISGLGVWPYTFGPSLGTVLPVIYKNVTLPPNPPSPTPILPGQEPPGGYPPPSPSPPPSPTPDGSYPPPGGGEAVAPPLPAPVGDPPRTPTPPLGALAGLLSSTPAPRPRPVGDLGDWSRASWLPAVLRAYRYSYCPEYCVDDTGQPPPPPGTPYPAEPYDRMPSAGFMAHLYAVSSDQVIDSCDDAAWSYGQWAYRLDSLSYYFQRWEDYVVNDDFYIQESGIINGAYIDYEDIDYWGSQPWDPESQTCNPNYGYPVPNPTYYQGCLAAVDLANRLSWYIVAHGQDLPGAKATGTSFLSADQYRWQGRLMPTPPTATPAPTLPPGVTPTATPLPTSAVPYIEWMPLGRGDNCQVYDPPGCLSNNPDVDWSVSPNAYGFFLGARETPSTFCEVYAGTPVPILPPPFTPGPRPTNPPNPAELGPRPYGPVYGWEPPPNMDFDPPTSAAVTLTTWQTTAAFSVTWTGQDDAFGVMSYDVQYATYPTLTWSGWLTWTTATSATFDLGAEGATYCFRSRARDWGYALEDWPADPGDTCTTPDLTAPSSQVAALPAYSLATFTVTWSGSDALSGLHHYNIYYRDEAAASWTAWMADATYTQTTFYGTPGHTYHFCSRGVDNLGNAEVSCPPILGQAWPIPSDAHTGVTPWSRVDDLPAGTAGRTIHVTWSGAPGQQVVYDVQVRDGLYGQWLRWQSGVTATSADYTGQYGHIYYFRSRQRAAGIWEVYPYDYDTFTKLIDITRGAAAPPSAPLAAPPDEAPDRREEVTRTQTLGTPVVGYIAPIGDVDWYRFELTATLRLRIQLAELPADFDLYVFDGNGEFLWASTWGRQLPEEVVVRVPAGVYYVQLVGYAGAWSGETPYRLLVKIVE